MQNADNVSHNAILALVFLQSLWKGIGIDNELVMDKARLETCATGAGQQCERRSIIMPEIA